MGITFVEWLEDNEPKVWRRFSSIPPKILKKMRLGEHDYGKFLYREWEKWRERKS